MHMDNLVVKSLPVLDYGQTYQCMIDFTDHRNRGTPDEIWCLQHHPVFTLGMGGKPEHLLAAGTIPVVKTDRGGQVTYHGPGQLIVYFMLDLKRQRIHIKQFIYRLEQSIIDFCHAHSIDARRQPGAPGVYVADKKLAALGIRVRHGCCYHGLAINVDMDTGPFNRINPCGYPGLQVTQLSELGQTMNTNQVFNKLLPYLIQHLNYQHHHLIKLTSDDVSLISQAA